ncbi:hypothetical protein BASA83_010473 [Batrachochytrium salamandrivorans]|nr:hypothetical protein BASA83_010473 [Batrachochytrium salamandrivorans]
MSPRKAPGDDGITTALYQAALYMPANTQEGVPPTSFARALLRVCGWFRKREECVGQVVSLVDIIQRRQNAGLNTHVLFIDIRKAFDTVPVGALLWKLQNMGFPRRTLVFLKALYTSHLLERAGSLPSDPFPVQRGVKQGCPLSGLLFNLFINDILDGVAPITVPGLSRNTNPIRGLMYADDVQCLLILSNHCWLRQLLSSNEPFVVWESYKYLGVLIDSKLDHSAWLKQKTVCIRAHYLSSSPSAGESPANGELSFSYILCSGHGQSLLWLKLVGGNKSHLAPLQTTINKGIRLFTGARLSTAIGPLLAETGIGSPLTRSLVSRVRLLERSMTKKTPINAICSSTDNDVFTLNVQGQLVRSQRWFWSRRAKQLYRSRYWLTPRVRPKTVKQRHSFALVETLRTCGDSASLQKQEKPFRLAYWSTPTHSQLTTAYYATSNYSAHPIAHLVVECEQVTGHRIQSGLVPAIQKSRLRLLGLRTRSGCGECIYLAPRWSLKWRSRSRPVVWLDGTVEHESMGTRHDNRVLAARLAGFLQVVYWTVSIHIVAQYHRDRLVEVG